MVLEVLGEFAEAEGYLREALARFQRIAFADKRDGLFTVKELAVVRLLASGKSNAAIARELIVAPSTIKWHLKHLYAKLQVHSRTQAVACARQLQLLE